MQTKSPAHNQVVRLDQRLGKMQADFDQRFAKIEGELRLLSSMVGFNLAATVAVFFMLLRH
jgi:hypothetical protein